jgi:hypothetical protein
VADDSDAPPVTREITRQAKHVKLRRSEGKCAREGCPEQSGKRYLCQVHRTEHRIKMRSKRRLKREAKLAAA